MGGAVAHLVPPPLATLLIVIAVFGVTVHSRYFATSRITNIRGIMSGAAEIIERGSVTETEVGW